MKYITHMKSIGVVCVACSFVLGSIFVFMPVGQVDASNSSLIARGGSKSDSKKSSKPSSKPKKSSSSKLPSGGKKSNNSYAKKSLSGNCKKVGKYCVTFSKSGCGNFYIKGRHYGGSQSCRILGKKCGNNNGGGGSNNTNVTRTVNVKTTAPVIKQVATSTLQRECTPGVDCPQDDLGPIIRQALVTPAYAAKNSNTCPLFWVAGEQSKDSTIKCTLVLPDGTKNDVPTDPITNGYESGYPLPVGKSTLVCLRSTTYDENVMGEKNGKEVILSTTKKVDTETQERVVECKQNPAVREL